MTRRIGQGAGVPRGTVETGCSPLATAALDARLKGSGGPIAPLLLRPRKRVSRRRFRTAEIPRATRTDGGLPGAPRGVPRPRWLPGRALTVPGGCLLAQLRSCSDRVASSAAPWAIRSRPVPPERGLGRAARVVECRSRCVTGRSQPLGGTGGCGSVGRDLCTVTRNRSHGLFVMHKSVSGVVVNVPGQRLNGGGNCRATAWLWISVGLSPTS
jgi:hypothetical protein